MDKRTPFAAILNHLNFGWTDFSKALKILSAFNLVTPHQRVTAMNLLFIQRFLAQISCIITVYQNLIGRKKIGESAVSDLRQEQAGGSL